MLHFSVWPWIRGFKGGHDPLGSQDPHLMEVDQIRPTSRPAPTPTSRRLPSGGPVTSYSIRCNNNVIFIYRKRVRGGRGHLGFAARLASSRRLRVFLIEETCCILGQWEVMPSMLEPRASPSVAAVDNRIYVFGGDQISEVIP